MPANHPVYEIVFKYIQSVKGLSDKLLQVFTGPFCRGLYFSTGYYGIKGYTLNTSNCNTTGKSQQAWVKNGQDRLVGDEIVLELTEKREIKKITADGGQRQVSFSFTSKSGKKAEAPAPAPATEGEPQ